MTNPDHPEFATLKSQLSDMWPQHDKTAHAITVLFVLRAQGIASTSCPSMILCGPTGSGTTEACFRASRLLYGKDPFLFSMAETAVPHPDRDIPAALRSLAEHESRGIVVLGEIEKAPEPIILALINDLLDAATGRLRHLHVVITSSFPPKRLIEHLRPEIAPKLGTILSLY